MAVTTDTLYISSLTQYVMDAAANYSTAARPSFQTAVMIAFILVKTISLSNTGVLEVIGALSMIWRDSRLTWNPLLFGNISMINVPSNSVWTPTLSLINSASDNFITASDALFPVTVLSTGEVSFIIQKQFTSTCALNLDSFPFDSQSCTIQFVNLGSASLSQPAVYFVQSSSGVSLDLYSTTGEFTLTGAFLNASGLIPNLCTNNQCLPSVQIFLNYQRRSTYYLLNLIVPAFLITIILPFAFILPSDNSVKISMTCSLMTALYVLQQNVSKMLPPSASSSMCSMGSVISLIIGCCAVVGTIMTVALRSKMPEVSNAVSRKLRQLLLSSKQQHAKVTPSAHETSSSQSNDQETSFSKTSKLTPTNADDDTRGLMHQLVLLMDEQVRMMRNDATRSKLAAEKSHRWTLIDAMASFVVFIIFISIALITMLVYMFQI